MGGLSSKYKERWGVLMPYYPLATGLTPKPARRCLWLYKDAASVSPRCRVWVDGAKANSYGPAGRECTLVSE